MGPLLFAGLAILGAGIGLGRVAAAMPPRSAFPEGWMAAQSLSIIAFAYIEGVGVIGVVVGLVAIMTGLDGEPLTWLVPLVPGLIGTVLGLAQIQRADPAPDRRIARVGMLFIAGLGVLAIVLAIESVAIGRHTDSTASLWVFGLLGLGPLVSGIGLGWTAAAVLPEVTQASKDPALARRRGIVQISRWQWLGVAAGAVAIVLEFAVRG